MQPTHEQQTIIDLFDCGLSIAIQAGSGTGKTTTLKQLGVAAGRRRGQYTAFNRPIVEDTAGSMPTNVKVSTIHSLAMRRVGNRFRHRIESGRQPSDVLARRLDAQGMVLQTSLVGKKVLARGYMAGLAMRGVREFCFTDDPEPDAHHVPFVHGVDLPDGKGHTGTENNELIREAVVPLMRKAWADLCDPDGDLPYQHDHYLKLWELSDPQIGASFLMLDEAQDASPVMLSIMRQQRDCQLIAVGDSQQQIYGWRGAVDALDRIEAEAIAYLTQSFRFGQRIADLANLVLTQLHAPLRLVGHPSIDSVIAPLVEPEAILTRSNAIAVQTVMEQQRAGRRVFLVGGGKEVASFVRGARDLQTVQSTSHPDLACFTSWGQVQAYVRDDPQGDELKLLVDLVDEFKAEVILTALTDGMPDESLADVVVSTAHKAKGREWSSVQLADDFHTPDDSTSGREEWRLLYVALTRAKHHLDVEGCTPLQLLLHPERRTAAGRW